MPSNKFFDYIELLTLRVEQQIPWAQIKEEFYQLACLDDEKTANYINQIDLSSYLHSLRQSMAIAIKKAKQKNMSAVYFEYDCDNGWSSDFFLCNYYLPKELLDDNDSNEDWACEFDDEIVVGPQLPEFSDLFVKTEADGVMAYLVALTVISFGTIFADNKVVDLALCIAFHDQDPIMRIQEYFPPDEKVFDKKKHVPKPKPVEPLTDLEHYIIRHYSPVLKQIQSDQPDETFKSIIKQALSYYKNEIALNLCPFCGELRRTPRAKQCQHCFKRE